MRKKVGIKTWEQKTATQAREHNMGTQLRNGRWERASFQKRLGERRRLRLVRDTVEIYTVRTSHTQWYTLVLHTHSASIAYEALHCSHPSVISLHPATSSLLGGLWPVSGSTLPPRHRCPSAALLRHTSPSSSLPPRRRSPLRI